MDISLSVPAANTDGTKPADLDRVDVYGFTGAASSTPEEIYREGARVGSVLVNPPADPDESEEQKRRRPAVPRGLDQGAAARLKEDLVGPPLEPGMARSYVGVGVNKRGRRGPLSRLSAVPLVEPPPPPSEPKVQYDESNITVTWSAAVVDPSSTEKVEYRVYEPNTPETPLTDRPLSEPQFVDRRIAWGAERCYAVRAVKTVEALHLESELSDPTCVKLTDTFAPAAPTGLTAVAAQGAISLLWEASGAADLAGYLVFRAIAPATAVTRLTPAPIQETTFTDQVMPGARVTYAVQAIDKAGNASPLSMPIEETAR